MLFEEFLIGQQLLRDTLNHIQPVHTQHDLPPCISVEKLGNVPLYLISVKSTCESFRIDADGEGGHSGDAAVVLDTFGRAFKAKDPRAGGDEVTGVVVSVESDEISSKDSLKVTVEG